MSFILTEITWTKKPFVQLWSTLSILKTEFYVVFYLKSYINATSNEDVLYITISIDHPSTEEIANTIIKLRETKLQVKMSAEIIYLFVYKAWSNEQFTNSWTNGAIVKLPKENDRTDINNWRGITLLHYTNSLLQL